MFGDPIVDHEKIAVNKAFEPDDFAYVTGLPSGAELWVNKLALDCDLLITEGFIEPHFFAWFLCGRKASFLVLPPEKPLCTIMRPAIFMILIPSQAFWKEILFMKICSLLPKLLESALS